MTDRDVPAVHLPLKPLELSVLLVLAEGEEYGYRIVKRIAEREAGGIRLAPSNLYHVLDRMIDAGLVVDRGRRAEGDRPPRRYYGVSELGLEVLSAEASRLESVLRTAARLDLVPARERS